MKHARAAILAIPGVQDILKHYDCDIKVVAKIKSVKTKKVSFKGVPLTRSSGNKETYTVEYPMEGEVAFSSNLPTKDIIAKLEAAHQFINANISPENMAALNKIAMTPHSPHHNQKQFHLFDVIDAMFDGANDEIFHFQSFQGCFTYSK